MPALRKTLIGLAVFSLAMALMAESKRSKADQPKTPEAKQATAEDAKNFFNGKDLSNWWGDMTLFTVKDGEIVGKTTTGLKQNEFLKSKLAVGDFRFVCKIKLVPNEGNSGIQFRSVPHNGNEMAGPQADAGKGWWGKLYGENFGDKVIGDNKSGEQVVKPNEWNTYEVLAVGTKVRTAINGHLCVDEDIPNLPKTGIFGLQVHAGGPTEVRFKDLELELDPKFELKTIQPSSGKAHALESGQTSIPFVKDFVHFFPGAIHDISYYTGVAGPPTWRSQVGLFGRYFLVMEVGIKVDSAKGTIINWGEPKFILREVEAVAWDAKTRTETVTPGTLNLEFGSQKWKIVTDHNGDLEALGISLKKGRPAPGFEEYWHGN